MLKSRVTTKKKECIPPRLRDEKLQKKKKTEKNPLKTLMQKKAKKGRKKNTEKEDQQKVNNKMAHLSPDLSNISVSTLDVAQ